LLALAVVAATLALAWRLWREPAATARRYALALVGLLTWQLASGLSNVVLGWPIVAALAHSAGAAALVGVLTSLWARARSAQRTRPAAPAAGLSRATVEARTA